MTEPLEPTDAEIESACLSYRHDFGLLPEKLKAELRHHAKEWLQAWQKEPIWNRRPAVSVETAAGVQSVASALESWATARRAGRSVEPSIVGLTDMVRALRALAGRNG